MTKQTILLRQLACLVLLIGFINTAHAEDTPCPEGGCPTDTATPATPSLRESIDNNRNKLTEKLFGLELTGFGDVLSLYDDQGSKKYDWGNFEVDATAELAENLQIAYATVRGKERWNQTVGLLDFHTEGIGRIAPRGRIAAEKGVHIQIGRFDIPFGNDWQFFPTKDSVSMSRPLTTEQIFDGGYNDEGIRVLGNNGFVNFTAYAVHGFNFGRLFGTRIGVTPLNDPFALNHAKDPKALEIGWSYFYDTNVYGWDKNETAWAIDAELLLDDWHSKFEYMERKKEPATGSSDLTTGWHFTQEYNLGGMLPWTTKLFLSYEQTAILPAEINAEDVPTGDARDTRVLYGFNTNIGNSDVLLWKVELRHQLSATPTTRGNAGYGSTDIWFTQLVLIL